MATAKDETLSIQAILDFLSTGVWRVRVRQKRPMQTFCIRILRILVLSVKNFGDNKCTLRAASLTFYTLLSIVPVLAMVFAVAKGFGFEHSMERKILEFAEGQEVAVRRLIEFARNLLENTSGGLIAGAGVVVLFWSVVRLLSSIELAFNEIWGVQRTRTWVRKLSDYMFFVIIAPIFFMTASSATVVVTAEVQNLARSSSFFEALGWVALTVLHVLPLILVWTLFVFMYLFMPNCKVRWASALLGGIVAGSLFQLTQWGYIAFQVGVTRYGAIYGSFAALPLFLIWLNMSWLIVLYGAELSFARQHVDTYEFEPDCRAASLSVRKLFALGTVQACVKRFDSGGGAPTAEELSAELGAPIRLLNQLIEELLGAGVLSEVVRGESRGVEVRGYQPALPTDKVTVQDVLDRLEDCGQKELPMEESSAFKNIEASLAQLREVAARSEGNVRLRDL